MLPGGKVHAWSWLLRCNPLYLAAIKLVAVSRVESTIRNMAKSNLMKGHHNTMAHNSFPPPVVHSAAFRLKPVSFIIQKRRLFEARSNKPGSEIRKVNV